MKKKNIIYIEGQDILAVRARKSKVHAEVTDTQCFAADKLEEYLRANREGEYILVVNFKRYYFDTITVPAVSRRYMRRVIASEISRKAPFEEFSFIHTLSEEKIVDNKKKREVHVFAVDMEELHGYIKRFAACRKSVLAIYPVVYAAKALLSGGVSGLALFNAGHEQKMFLEENGEVVFIRDVERNGGDLLESEARNIYLSISYCQQSLRLNPERLFLIGDICSLPGAGALTLPAASVLRPPGLDVSEEVFIKYALPLAALYADKSIDIRPKYLQTEHLVHGAQRYATVLFFALSFIGLIFLAFTVQRAGASPESITLQRQRLAHISALQGQYMKSYSKYIRYRSFFESGGRRPFSRLLYNLSAMNLPGVTTLRLSASAEEQGVTLRLNGLIKASTLRETQAGFDSLLKYIKGVGAMTLEEQELMFNDKSFTLKASLR